MTQMSNATQVSLFVKKIGITLLAFITAATLALVPVSEATQSAYAAEGNTLVIAIDPGHGGSDPGAGRNGLWEDDVNWDIAVACVNELNTYYGVKAVLCRSNRDTYQGLSERVDSAVAQKADAVISLHCNSASSSSANGAEVWVQNNSAYNNHLHSQSYYLGKSILEEICNSTGVAYRGVYTKNNTLNEYYPSPGGLTDYYTIPYRARLAGIPGLIVEHAFLSNSSDWSKLNDSSTRKALGIADATGIAKYYGLSKTAPSPELEKTGEEVETSVVSGLAEHPTIMGETKVTADQMASYYKSVKGNSAYPSDVYTQYGAPTIEDFCKLLYEEAVAEGVRAEVLFAQVVHETGWLQFGGLVKVEECNFGGIGATDSESGRKIEDFGAKYGENGVRMGLRAQTQHLRVYAEKITTADLNNECVDPRFSLVNAGCAAHVTDLGSGKWASAEGYGDRLREHMVKLYEHAGISEITKGDAKINVSDIASVVAGSQVTVYIDGKPVTVSSDGDYVTLPVEGEGTFSAVVYEYNTTDMSNPHNVYPTKMYTWLITVDGSKCVTKRCYGLDDMLQYKGSSIRISGTKGIRMITGMPTDLKASLSGASVLGYSLVETGTLIAYSDKVGDSGVTFDTSGVSRGKAYIDGSQNPVFGSSAGVELYTNVLVGFTTPEHFKRDLTMRPYAILEDATGNEVVIYGGQVQRSIGYIAEQNADEFEEGTEAYNFVHEIIDAYRKVN